MATHLDPLGVSDPAADSDPTPAGVEPPSRSRRWQPTPATFIWLFALAWGLRIGLQPLSDNSLLTHIATGRIIFDTGFPRSDPYLFTPHEPSWVVQSWLGSVIYWGLVKTWGMGALMAFNAALTALLAVLIVRLARPADGFVARLGLVILTLGVGASAWAERPLMIGLVLLAVTLIAAEDGLDPRWLVPVMFVWVNSHGSFPLGIVALALLWAGRRLDGGEGRVEWRCLKWAIVGTAVGALNPYGPKLLLFPISMLQRSDILRTILEWQAPTYDTIWQKLFLVQIAVAVVVLVRRPSWRLALPFVVFVPASLYSARNILAASLVLTAAMAPSLAGIGELKANARLSSTPLAWLGGFAMAALCAAMLTTPLGKPTLDLTSYPVAALAYLDANDLVPPPDGSEGRLLTQDFVGNLREYLDGPVRDVFIDDRAEVIGEQASADYISLLGVHPNWRDSLDRNDINVIVWQKDFALAAILAESPDWQIRYRDPNWIVAVRRPPA